MPSPHSPPTGLRRALVPALLAAAAGLAWACSEGGDRGAVAETPTIEPAPDVRRRFALNLPAERVRVDGRAGHDLRGGSDLGVVLRTMQCGERFHRTLGTWPGKEVAFAGALEDARRLHTAIGFAALADGPAPTLRFELAARGADGSETPLWTAEHAPPASEDERRWHDVDVAVGERAGDELVLRVERAEAAGPELALDLMPGWANPTVELVDRALPPPAAAHRNVVVYLIDTLRADRVGAYGNPAPASAHIDALADEGVLFRSASATAPWTKPSVASLFTSRLPSDHGAEDYTSRMRDEGDTLAAVFRAAGYRTAAFGCNGWVFRPSFNLGRGFEEFVYVRDGRDYERVDARAVTSEALDWLERNYTEPFLLYVHSIDPHEPYSPPDGRERLFHPRPYRGTLDGSLEGPGTHTTRAPDEVDAADLAWLHALYDGELHANDEEVGRLVRRLRALGVWDETTFVVTADHGDEFLEHGDWSHGKTVYQEVVHVPLVLKPPASLDLAPAAVDAPVSLLDLAPTLCELAGLDPGSTTFAGRSLVPLVRGEETGLDRPLAIELRRARRVVLGVRRGPWKYVAELSPEPGEELYHLASDPREERSVLDELPAGQLAAFRAAREAFRASARASGLHVELCAGAEPVTATVKLRTAGELRDFDLVDAERGEDWQRLKPDLHGDVDVLIAHFELGGGDRSDLLLIEDPPAALELEVLLGGTSLPPERILLGAAPEHPRRARFVVEADDPALRVDAPPPRRDAPGLWCRVFRLEREEVELDDETRSELEALGYLGED